MSTIDHLVVAAATLDEGTAWVHDTLGVAPEPGGRHEAFGTHNALVSLGPQTYLEVIAIDAEAPVRARPRWFELDTPGMRERLAAGPALVHWVVRVASVDEITDPLELSRGTNRWVLGVPPDGRMPLGGLAPSRILWRTPPPPRFLPDKGVRLEELTVSTPDPTSLWRLIADVAGPVTVVQGTPGLSVRLTKSAGALTVGTPRVGG